MENLDTDLQLRFLNRIKDMLPDTQSLVYELAELLQISSDSAYRRLRGETSLSFNEVVVLCNHFKISFDSFINIESGNVTFNYTLMGQGENSLREYLSSMRNDLRIIKKAPNPLIIYACEDIPIFHNINERGIAAFKMMYWMKAILNVPELFSKQFDENELPEDMLKLGQEIYQIYCSIPSIEIWTDTTIRSTLKQIEYFWYSGVFKSREDFINILSALKETIHRIQKKAEFGDKSIGNPEIGSKIRYDIYHSDIELTNNCVLVSMDSVKAVYLGHLTFNSMNTSNATYCHETEQWLNNILKKATLISEVAEKNRYQFFKKMYSEIDRFMEETV